MSGNSTPRCGYDDNLRYLWDMKENVSITKCATCGATDKEDGKEGAHEALPSLDGRRARCSYYKSKCGQETDSRWGLAFFEFTGEGSHRATDICTCGFARIAHAQDAKRPLPKPHEFVPKGAEEFDRFYCGCFGWD